MTLVAAIPYRTFPTIGLGPVSIHTFGVMVALGVLAGAVVAARHGERHGVERDDVYRLATRLALGGIVGARVTWDLTHWSDIHSPLDLIALWKGGLQFSGGFVAAVALAVPIMRHWAPLVRWRLLDGVALGLTVGLAIGRIGCYSVGEHLGGPTNFLLAVRYEGGATREGPLVVGQAIHNTALYEFVHLLVLAGLLAWLLSPRRARPVAPGTAVGAFCLWYGVARFATDFLRAYDHTVAGLTGAQWMCLVVAPAGLWILLRGRHRAGTLGAGAAEPAAV